MQTQDENAGGRVRCPACQRELVVPYPKPNAGGDFAEFGARPDLETSGKAVASLILGICSFVFCCLTGIPAIIFGILGLNDISNPMKRVTGKGMATSGIVLGCITTFLALPAMLVALLLPAVQAAREAARRAQCSNNHKQIALALLNYESANGAFPPAARCDASGQPLLSWRVLILPYLERQDLYSQFHLDEPWDSPNNKPLADRMPDVFKCPSEPNLAPGMTTYQVIVDPRGIFTGEPTGVPLADVTDGASTTLMLVEAKTPVPWTKPAELSVASPDPLLGMGSTHPGGVNATFADGSVRFIRNNVDPRVIRGMVSRNGGEMVADDGPGAPVPKPAPVPRKVLRRK